MSRFHQRLQRLEHLLIPSAHEGFPIVIAKYWGLRPDPAVP
jgi:hypothetical protein